MKYSHVSFESEVAAIQKLGVLTPSCLDDRIDETFVDSDRKKNIDNRVKSAIPA
jgi:hypothetical protein